MSERFRPEQPSTPESGSRGFWYDRKEGNKDGEPKAEGERSFWYEDETGQKHRVEGTPDSPPGELEEESRSFWYTDDKGERKQISGARRWWYENDDKGSAQEKGE